jgi:hypothetical protein
VASVNDKTETVTALVAASSPASVPCSAVTTALKTPEVTAANLTVFVSQTILTLAAKACALRAMSMAEVAPATTRQPAMAALLTRVATVSVIKDAVTALAVAAKLTSPL